MKQLVLEKIVVSGFPPINKRCLWLKGNTFYFWFKGAWRSVDSNIDVNEDFIEKTVKEEVTNAINDTFINGADENHDSFGEIQDILEEYQGEASSRDAAIEELQKNSGWTNVQ